MRTAIRYAEKALDVDRLLLSKELRTTGGQIFLERYSELINLSASGQLALRRFFDEHLKRVEWDEGRFPIRLYPFLSSESIAPDRSIAIDPQIAFGRPIIFRVGVSTFTIAVRIDAGESVADLAEDYGVAIEEIEQAVIYERVA